MGFNFVTGMEPGDSSSVYSGYGYTPNTLTDDEFIVRDAECAAHSKAYAAYHAEVQGNHPLLYRWMADNPHPMGTDYELSTVLELRRKLQAKA